MADSCSQTDISAFVASQPFKQVAGKVRGSKPDAVDMKPYQCGSAPMENPAGGDPRTNALMAQSKSQKMHEAASVTDIQMQQKMN